MNIILVIISIAFALARVLLAFEPNLNKQGLAFQTFKDFAHLYVGGLIGASLAAHATSFFVNAALLSLVELIVGIATFKRKK